MAPAPVPLHHVTRWPLWSVPRRLLAPVLAVELLTLCLIVAGVFPPPRLDHPTVVMLVTLSVAGVLHTEVVAGVERLRRYSPDAHHVNLTSVWTFASALLLPPVLGALVAAVIYTHLYLRVLRPVAPTDRPPVYREVYSFATVVLAVHAAAAVSAATRPDGLYGAVPDVVALVLALLAYTVVNTCLVLGVVAMTSPDTQLARVLFGRGELVLELATLSLGALMAGALVASGPLTAVLAIPPILALHRTTLVRELRERADIDVKTGLLNHATWLLRGSHALQVAERERRPAALLLLDLDHFKDVNDTHGHLYGDQVLSATARALGEELRDHDLIGRFGGEEFAILLSRLSGDDGTDEVRQVAERLRHRVSGLQMPVAESTDGEGGPTGGTVTVSVGAAVFPADGSAIRDLLEVADSALYAAKRAGRDTVRVGLHPFPIRRPDNAEDRVE